MTAGGTGRIIEVVPAPGVYDDGPVFLRITRRTAGGRWPVPGFRREVNDRELENDDVHDWIRVEQNSRAAHAYRDRLLVSHHLPPRSVAVVRIRAAAAPGERPGTSGDDVSRSHPIGRWARVDGDAADPPPTGRPFPLARVRTASVGQVARRDRAPHVRVNIRSPDRVTAGRKGPGNACPPAHLG